MSAVGIPLAGASVEHLERRGTWLVVTLTTEEAGRVQLLFFNGEAHGTAESLPLPLAAGSLDSSEGPLGSHIPMPFPHLGTVELHLEGSQGERLTIVGQQLTVHVGDPGGPVVQLGRS